MRLLIQACSKQAYQQNLRKFNPLLVSQRLVFLDHSRTGRLRFHSCSRRSKD